ncbi:MAG: MFS transporter [bacterium]|nr:MFS transporter [bacterium]
MAPASAMSETAEPSRTRYRVVGFAVVLSVITYIDRVSISQAAPSISKDLGLTKVEMGLALSAFAVAYALFQVPGGWMSDWKGPRRVLTVIVVWWSVFTAATGWTWNLVSLVAARFGFGAGQGGGFPVLTKAFTTWLPGDERVRAQGIMWMSARWGGAFTPLLVVALLQFLSWRRVFEVFGLLGLVWAVFFWRWFRDDPRKHKGPNPAELALLEKSAGAASGHGDVPWGRFLRSRTIWLLWLQYFCEAYGWYFYITWLPTYLQEARGQTMAGSALLSAFPLFFGGLGCLFCGFALRYVERWLSSAAAARRLMSGLGLTGAGALLVVSVHLADPLWAMVAMGLASFSNDLAMPPAWAACMDVGGNYAGSLSGSMNTAGNIAGWVAPLMIPLILSWTNDNWALTFYVSAVVYLIGALCWAFIDPVTPLDEAEPVA